MTISMSGALLSAFSGRFGARPFDNGTGLLGYGHMLAKRELR